MNKLSFLLCTSALTATLVGLTDAASADVITDKDSPLTYGPVSTPVSAETLDFAGFTASGGTGTLTGVTVTLTDYVSGTVTGTNITDVTLTYNASVENKLTISDQPANLSLPTTIDISNTSGTETVTKDSAVTSGTLTGTKTKSSDATGSLSDFLGSWSITYGEMGTYNGTAQDGIDLSAVTTGKVVVDVTYDYTPAPTPTPTPTPSPIPEPLSIGLLGAGLAGLGVVRRRRPKV